MPMQFHRQNDLWTTQLTIPQHDHGLLRPQTTCRTTTNNGEKFMVENLWLLIQDVSTIQIDRHRSLQDWIHKASNKKYWCQLVDQLLHPTTPLPGCPADWGPLPSWHAHRATNSFQYSTTHNGNDNNNGHPPPHHHKTTLPPPLHTTDNTPCSPCTRL
jgi:hypothetical protein